MGVEAGRRALWTEVLQKRRGKRGVRNDHYVARAVCDSFAIARRLDTYETGPQSKLLHSFGPSATIESDRE